MALPFERVGSFIVWYLDKTFPLVITQLDFKRLIELTEFEDPLAGFELMMAVTNGVGREKYLVKASNLFTKTLRGNFDSNGWPYTSSFESSNANEAFHTYFLAFSFCNKKFSAESFITSIDRHEVCKIYRKGIFRNKEIFSFSINTITRVVGSSVEFFVGLNNSNYLYFGRGKIKLLNFCDSNFESEYPDYFELMSLI